MTMEEYFNYLKEKYIERGLSLKVATEKARDTVIYYLEGVVKVLIIQMCLGFPVKEGEVKIR